MKKLSLSLLLVSFAAIIFFSPQKASATTWTPGNVTSCGTLSVAGDYYLQNDLGTSTPVSGTCFPITDNNVIFHGNGHTMYGAANSVGFDASTSTLAVSAYGTTTIDNLTLSGFTTAFKATGGANDNAGGSGLNGGVGSNGGSVIITNSHLSGSVSSTAGTNTNRNYAQSGLGGNIIIGTSTISGTVTDQGGNGWGHNGNSGGITITNATVSGTTTSAGGSGYNNGPAGSSGVISVSGSSLGNISSTGGSGSSGGGGATGNVTIASSTVGSITSTGGTGPNASFAPGGSAGTLTLTANVVVSGNILSQGGNADATSSTAGNGGSVYIGPGNTVSNILISSIGGTAHVNGTSGTLTIADSGTTVHVNTTLSSFSDLISNGNNLGAYSGGSWPIVGVLSLSSPTLAADGKTITATISGGSGTGNSPSSNITGLTVKAGSITHLISSSSISGSTLTIVLGAPIPNTPTTLAIATSSNLTDSAGNTPSGQSGIAVTNNSVQKIDAVTTYSTWNYSGLSNGVDTAANARVAVVVPFAASNFALVYANAYGLEVSGPNAITLTAAVEYNGTSYPVTWGGATSTVLQPGQAEVTDPIAGLSVPAGATIYTRSHVKVSSGGQWPVGITYDVNNPGSGYESGTSSASQIDKTTQTGPLTADPFEFGFGPNAVVGIFTGSGSAVCVYGDSIATGQAEGHDDGYIVDAINPTYPYLQLTMPGDSMASFVSSAGNIRRSLATYCTHAVVQYGTNDTLTNLSAFQANAISAYQSLETTNPGLKIYQTTITPRTTSTDNWMTTANQTPVSGFGPNGGEVHFNDWLRDGAPIVSGTAVATGTTPALRYGQSGNPLSGYFEAADIDESSHDSGLWKVNGTANYYTLDGIHPTGVMHQLMKAAITLSTFSSDTTSPTVTLTAPTSGSILHGTSLTLTATSSDNIAVTAVQFKIDGINTGATGSTSPYSITWNSTGVADGSHIVAAVASDAAGNLATSSVTVTVQNSAPVIASIGSSTSQTTATITWTTNNTASSTVNYGSTLAYGLASTSVTLALSHSIVLSGLTAGTTYHFQVGGGDVVGNTSTSTDQTFTTTAIVSTSTPPSTTSTDTGVGVPSSGGGYAYIPAVSDQPTIPTTTCSPGDLFDSQTGSRCPGTYTPPPYMPPTPHVPFTPYTYPSVPTSTYTFSHDLTLGSDNKDVTALQQFLTTQGFLNKRYDTGYFGVLTRTALSKFQAKYGISPSVGYFGAKTRSAVSGE